jgi:hypothetical protein
MRENRDSLKLAGKAAGIPARIIGAAPGSYALYPDADGVSEFCCMRQWDPLTDDGDALRLAMKLGMDILQRHGDWPEVVVIAPMKTAWVEPVMPHCIRSEATRLAIVRAAAEIGRAMP